MGLLLSRTSAFLAELCNETTYRILMLGLDQSGKTTILYKLKLDEVIKTIPTIGFNIETIQRTPSISFEVWDAGGQAKYRPLLRFYFQNCQGFFFVVDSSDHSRFHEARDVLFKIIKDEYMPSVPFVVIGNKSDLPTAATQTELIELFDLHSISQRLWSFHSVCAITGEGIFDAMQQLAKLIKNNRRHEIFCQK